MAERTPEEPRPEQPPDRELSEFANPEVEIDQHVEPRAHLYPSTVGGFAYLAVVGVMGWGLLLASRGSWQAGMGWLGSAVLGAALVRLVLPESQTGMLHVRRRLVDVVLLVVLGTALLAIAASISG